VLVGFWHRQRKAGFRAYPELDRSIGRACVQPRKSAEVEVAEVAEAAEERARAATDEGVRRPAAVCQGGAPCTSGAILIMNAPRGKPFFYLSDQARAYERGLVP
jgi:hypothetical protein